MNVKYLKLYIICLTLFIVDMNMSGDSAASVSKSAVGKARIVTPISLVNTDNQGLYFGVISVGSLDSKIRVAATQTVLPDVLSGDAIVLTSNLQHAARFLVSGDIGTSYTITLPTSIILNSGQGSLTVDNFTCSNGTGGVIGTHDDFFVGAQLMVPNAALTGTYVGRFNITVAYN